jgi:transposase-like protein
LLAIGFHLRFIRYAVWLYMRFTLSYRDVEDLLAERGLDVSYETMRRWVLKFGPTFARELRRRRPRPTSRWHLDEMAAVIAGRQFGCGARLTAKVRFSTCSCNDGATRPRPPN